MGGIGKRIEYLEQRIQPPEQEDEAAALQKALIRDTLGEFASLKASRAVHYRGGKCRVAAGSRALYSDPGKRWISAPHDGFSGNDAFQPGRAVSHVRQRE